MATGYTKRSARGFIVHGEHSTAMQGNGDARVAFFTETARSLDTTGGYATSQGGTLVFCEDFDETRMPFWYCEECLNRWEGEAKCPRCGETERIERIGHYA